MAKTNEMSSARREGWSGGNCCKCGTYAAQLHWGVCPRCRRSRAGRALAAENKAKELANRAAKGLPMPEVG